MADRMTSETAREAARLYAAGDLVGAEQCCHQVLKRDKRDVNAWQLLGTIALQRGALEEALKRYRKCVDLRPREAHLHFLVGKALAVLGRLDEAVTRFEKTLKMKPGYALAISWLAATLERRGDVDRARSLLDPFVQAGTEDADMADVYGRILTHADDDEGVVAVAARHLARPDLEPRSRQALAFLAGRAYDRLHRPDEAFDAFSEANRLAAAPFDPESYVRFIDRLIGVFSEPAMRDLPRATIRSGLPVIIAGMPRSGTTLVEQVIDAHPAAIGVGEITEIESIAAELAVVLRSGQTYPECVRELTPPVCDRLARRYIDVLRRLGRRAERAVNKSLENYKLLGLIAMLWPDARVIFCRRDAMDTCLSCFMSHILPTKHPYKADLRHLGLVYRQHVRLMEHWRAVLDLPILEVVYEDLVADPDTRSSTSVTYPGMTAASRSTHPVAP
jgi:tetratricopeptide (TPR) repeat protein